jgi:hypothetical protein
VTATAPRRDCRGRVNNVAACADCGALVADLPGPRHPYLSAAPGCWASFCSLEDWKAARLARGEIAEVQDLVDAYAVQHPGNIDRRNRQSTAVHLMSMCAAVETGLSAPRRRAAIGRWTHRDYPPLTPPPSRFEVTASDVAATPVAQRPAMVERMASTTWAAWSQHHATVRSWLASSWPSRYA